MCEIFCIEQNYNSDRSNIQIAVPNMSTQNVRECSLLHVVSHPLTGRFAVARWSIL